MPKKISFMYEVTARCNQACAFCYNAWKGQGGAPPRELDTDGAIALLGRAIDGSRDCDVTLSGGEPLLRSDLCRLVACIKERGRKAIVASNGSLLDEAAIERLVSCGVDAFQVTLLADRKERHDKLAGAGSFERVLEAVLGVRRRGGKVYTFFPGLAANVDAFRRTLELNLLLGVEQVAFGRFTPGGAGLRGWESLLPSPEAIEEVLETGQAFCRKYGLSISISTPILPCLVDVARYDRIRFGFCAVGNPERAILGLDPAGNLKPCSHSSVRLGNLLESPLAELLEHEHLREFTETVPEYCAGCADLPVCRAGCRSSAQACYGSFAAEDPLLATWKARARKPSRPSFAAPESQAAAAD